MFRKVTADGFTSIKTESTITRTVPRTSQPFFTIAVRSSQPSKRRLRHNGDEPARQSLYPLELFRVADGLPLDQHLPGQDESIVTHSIHGGIGGLVGPEGAGRIARSSVR